MTQPPPHQWLVWETAQKRPKYLTEAETAQYPGAHILKLFWSARAQRYVSVPGASRFRVKPDGGLEPLAE
jgi:hypothetical protein